MKNQLPFHSWECYDETRKNTFGSVTITCLLKWKQSQTCRKNRQKVEYRRSVSCFLIHVFNNIHTVIPSPTHTKYSRTISNTIETDKLVHFSIANLTFFFFLVKQSNNFQGFFFYFLITDDRIYFDLSKIDRQIHHIDLVLAVNIFEKYFLPIRIRNVQVN